MHIPHPREIRAARLELGLSQEEAAQIVGVSESTWQKWEAHPMFSWYEEINRAAWLSFLVELEKLKAETSGHTLRRTVPAETFW